MSVLVTTRINGSAAVDRRIPLPFTALLVMLALCGAVSRGSAHAPPVDNRPQAPVPAPSQPAAAAATNYAFPSGAGLLFFYVKTDRTADFDAVVAKLIEVLDQTQDPVRKQQAAGWKILKSLETARDTTVYIFFFNPAVLGASYDPVKILHESLPAETADLYPRLRDAIVRVERMGLASIR